VPSSPLVADTSQYHVPPKSETSPTSARSELSEDRTSSPTSPQMFELGSGSRYGTMAAYEIDGGQVYEAPAYRDGGVGARY
jgi:hypothetical protein